MGGCICVNMCSFVAVLVQINQLYFYTLIKHNAFVENGFAGLTTISF